MASLEEFRTMLQGSEDERQQAMTDYVVSVDSASLDGNTEVVQACEERDVAFEFREPNIILMRAALPGDAKVKSIWYLPWVTSGYSKAELGPEGPAFFSTSQLDGCRFTVNYLDESRKHVTVLHLSGRSGTSTKLSAVRNADEINEFGALPQGPLVRRYSSAILPFSRGTNPSKRENAKMMALEQNSTILYSGNKAFIWGFRRKNGVWSFMAQEMNNDWRTGDAGLGYKPLTGV